MIDIKVGIIGIFFAALSIMVAYLGGSEFLISSTIFFVLGGAYEFIIMNKFHSKPKQHISRQDSYATKIKNAVLWVHRNVEFINQYNLTIYNSKKVGLLVPALSYFIVFLYVITALFLFKEFSYLGLLIYLIPVLSNIYAFFKHCYLINT